MRRAEPRRRMLLRVARRPNVIQHRGPAIRSAASKSFASTAPTSRLVTNGPPWRCRAPRRAGSPQARPERLLDQPQSIVQRPAVASPVRGDRAGRTCLRPPRRRPRGRPERASMAARSPISFSSIAPASAVVCVEQPGALEDRQVGRHVATARPYSSKASRCADTRAAARAPSSGGPVGVRRGDRPARSAATYGPRSGLRAASRTRRPVHGIVVDRLRACSGTARPEAAGDGSRRSRRRPCRSRTGSRGRPARWSGALEFGLGDIHDPSQHRRHEATAEDGPGPSYRLRLRRASPVRARIGVLDRVRHGRVDGSSGRRPARARLHDRDELLDVQRQAVRAFVDGRATSSREAGQSGPEQERRHRAASARASEPLEPHLRRRVAGSAGAHASRAAGSLGGVSSRR